MSGYHLLEQVSTILLDGIDGDWTAEWRHSVTRWLEDYRQWHETIQAQLPEWDESVEMVTKTGRIITDMDIESWVNEANARG